MEKLYTAEAKAIGGRNGHVETTDGLLKFDLSIPKGMGGPGKPNTTNPEQLFACAYAACFGGAVEFIAKQQKINLTEIAVTADVAIGRDESSFKLAVELKVSIPELDKQTVENLLQKAHQICPYSKATRGNIDVKLTVL